MDVLTTPVSGDDPGHGGRRRGAGRPKGDANALIAQLVGPNVPDVVGGLLQLARGAHVEKEIDGQKVVVYQILPDYKACAYLLDRVAGKPRQTVAITQDRPDPSKVAELQASKVAARLAAHKQLTHDANPAPQ